MSEAILPLLVRVDGKLQVSDRVLLLSDDGKRSIEGVHCEKLPLSQQFFRGIIAPAK